MENIKDATFYAKKIVEESRHKFIYAYSDNRKLLIEQIIKKYPITFEDKTCALYLEINGLPKIETDIKELNESTISVICNEYLSFSIATELVNLIISNNDIDKIKQTEHLLLNYINRYLTKGKINDFKDLFQLLKETKEIYFNIYSSYLNSGSLENPKNKTPLGFIELNSFIYFIKQMLGKKTHISFVLNHKKEVYLESYKVINNLISSRINSDISMNILTEPDTWKSYLNQGGELIESIHDYESVEYDESSSKYLSKMKTKYQNNYKIY